MAQGTAIRVAKNTLALSASKAMVLGFSFVFLVFAARYMGVEDFGKYALARSYFDLALTLCSSGLNIVLIRDIARSPELTDRYLSSAAVLVLGLAAIAAVLLSGAASVAGYAVDTQESIALASVALVPAVWSVMLEGAFVGHEKAEYVASVTLMENLLRTAFSFVALLMGYGLLALFVILVICRVVMLACYLFLFHVRIARLALALDWRFTRRLFLDWRVFALENWLSNLYLGLGTIILSFFYGERAVGPYAAVDKIVGWVLLFATTYTSAIFPVISRLFGESREGFQRVVEGSVKYMMALVLPFGVLVAMFADKIVVFLFTAAYAEAIPIMQVLIWVLVLRFLNPFLSHVLFARREQTRSLQVAAVTLVVYLVASFAMIPPWGGLGTAWSRLVATAAATCMYLWFVFGREGMLRQPLFDMARTLIAAFGAGVFMFALGGLPLLLDLSLAALLYIGLLFALRVATAQDIQQAQRAALIGLQKAGRLTGRAGSR